jgi:hypothetical protein
VTAIFAVSFKGGGKDEVTKMEELVNVIVTGQTSIDTPAAQQDVAPPADSKQDKDGIESDEALPSDGKEKGKSDGKRKKYRMRGLSSFLVSRRLRSA